MRSQEMRIRVTPAELEGYNVAALSRQLTLSAWVRMVLAANSVATTARQTVWPADKLRPEGPAPKGETENELRARLEREADPDAGPDGEIYVDPDNP